MPRMFRTALALAALGVATALLSACAPAPRVQCDVTPLLMGQEALRPGPRLGPLTPGTMTEVPLNAVSILDSGLRGRVIVQTVMVERNAAGNLEAGARIMNCTDAPLPIQGRAQFLDIAQRPSEAPSAWQRLHLPQRSMVVYSEVSVAGPSADSVLIELRSAD